MKYLSGLDNLFLEQETHSQHMHVGGIAVYDPSTAQGGKVRFKTVLDFFTSRMSEAPIFRRRLRRPPLGLDRPFWIEDPKVDVEYHVRHLALPHPGDWRQLMIQIARIHSRPLDLSKPLWEAYIIDDLDSIEGLPKGSFAMYLKFHHSAIDGEAAAHLIGSLHTLTAEFDKNSENKAQTVFVDREPNPLELFSRSIANRSTRAFQMGGLGLDLGRQALHTAKERGSSLLTKGDESLFDKLGLGGKQEVKRPMTRFNVPISPHRVLDAVGLALDDCQTIRKNVEGITINDIFLTVVGGGLKRYLAAKGESTASTLMGTMPMTLRGGEKGGDMGNQIVQVYYSLRTDIDDPVVRLRAVNRETAKVKDQAGSGPGKDIQKRMLDTLPASLIVKPVTSALGANANVNVSNVRGPDKPLYMAGARLEMFVPFSLIFDGCGLNITGFSYNGKMWVGVTCCREMLPDPAFLSDCLSESFEELIDAAVAVGASAGRKSSVVGRGVSTKKSASTKKKTASRKKAAAKKITRTVKAKN
jgi:diacylglycerol O-acyltransferase